MPLQLSSLLPEILGSLGLPGELLGRGGGIPQERCRPCYAAPGPLQQGVQQPVHSALDSAHARGIALACQQGCYGPGRPAPCSSVSGYAAVASGKACLPGPALSHDRRMVIAARMC